MNNAIINSLLDNDLYKFTMLQAFLHYGKDTTGEYTFICRTPNVDFSPILYELKEQIDHLCNLTFSKDELSYLSSLNMIKPFFIEYLSNFKLKRSNIFVDISSTNELIINIKAPIIEATFFEVPVLAIVNQLYFENKIRMDKSNSVESRHETSLKKLKSKLSLLKESGKEIRFTDFGTRRRFSFEFQKLVINEILHTKDIHFNGTSNVFFAKTFGIKPLGTMAHEWIMAHSGITNFRDSTSLALERWSNFYPTQQNIALTDTYTTDFFIKNIDPEIIKKYKGLRHDSGDWKSWGYKILDFYKKLGLNQKDKVMVFSDSLDFQKIIEIHNEFGEKSNLVFGIGTNLTNDVGYGQIQPVIKMIRCNSNPVIKLSDDQDKEVSFDSDFREQVLKEINL